MSILTPDQAGQRALAVPAASEPLGLRLGGPGPDGHWLPIAEATPMLLTGDDLGAHRTLRWLLGDWVVSLAETGVVDVLAWSEIDVFLDAVGRPGVSLTPSLGAWLRAMRQMRRDGVPQTTVFVGYEVTGTAGDELLAATAGQALEGPDWHLIWAGPTDSAGGHLASALPWRGRLDMEADARHAVLSRPGHRPARLLAAWDRQQKS